MTGAHTIIENAVGACNNDPKTVCKLLRAIAGGSLAKANRHDTILIAAAEMIEAFERAAGKR